MPPGAPIGTNKGLQTRDFLPDYHRAGKRSGGGRCRYRCSQPCRLSNGDGRFACLVNTAIAVAGNPVTMAEAFKQAVEAGRTAYEAGLGLQADNFVAEASSPLTAFLDE